MFRTLQVLGAYGLRGLHEQKPHFIESIFPALNNLKSLSIGLERDFPGRFVFLLPKDNVATARAYYEQHPEHIPWKNRETKN